MTHDVEMSDQDLVGMRALRQWITGERGEYSRVFLIEHGASIAEVEAVAGRDDVVLLPAGAGPYQGSARSAHYTGALNEIGDELFFGGRGIELQDYVAAAFVQIVGPTAVRVDDESSGAAFLEDAEIARATGIFPAPLIDPRVLLAGGGALRNPKEFDAPRALRVRADGGVSVGMGGDVIASVSDLQRISTAPVSGMPRWRDRDWIGRYLGATDLLKMLRISNGAVRISGFGWCGIDDALADAEPEASDPFLLETEDGFVLADPTTLRRQLLSPATATVVAATQTSTTLEVAAERVARQLSGPPREARFLCCQAVAALGIHLGERFDAAPRTDVGR